MATITNPTGYAIKPDLGPLFSPQSHTESHGVKSEISDLKSSPCSSVPSVVNDLRESTESAALASNHWYRLILTDLSHHDKSILPEICARIGAAQNQISGRLSDLRRKMYVVWTGDKRPAPGTRTGCMVYSITTAGREALARGEFQ